MTSTPTHGNSCFPFAVNCRFSKAFLGVPKRCGYCQKMIVGTGFTCQNCSFKCHRRCIMIGHGDQVCLRPKPCSLSRLPPGDDLLITKLLRENEINSNDMSDLEYPRKEEENGNVLGRTESSSAKIRRVSRPLVNQSSFNAHPSSSLPNDDPCCSLSLYSTSTTTSPSLISQPSSPGIFARRSHKSRRDTVVSNSGSRRTSAILVNSVNVTSSTNDEKRQSPQSNSLMGRIFRLFPAWSPNWSKNMENGSNGMDCMGNGPGSIASLHSVNSRRISIFKSKPLLHTKSTPSCHQVVSRVSTTRSHQGSPVASSAREFNRAAFEKLYEERRKSAHEILLTSAHCPQRQQNPNLLPFVDHKPTQNGTCHVPNRNLTVSDSKPPSISPLLHKFRLRAGIQETTTCGGHKFLRNHESDPIKVIERRSVILREFGGVSMGNGQDKDTDDDEMVPRLVRASTWPLSGQHIDYDEFDRLESEENENGGNANGNLDEETTCQDVRSRQTRLSDLGEWTIPYTDLVLSECVHECRTMTTYRGRWHGDVMIHTYDICKNGGDHMIRGFLEEVRTLTKIRHENVALFMGASVEAPLLAVVTSIRKGCNLYEAVHLESRRLANNAKVNIARQIAQGMGYLHAKGIILRTLTSKSIYLECKVKISIVDDGAPLKRHDRPNMGCIRRGHLAYISPELIRKIRVMPPALVIDGVFTKESDAFAFGTILFEMFANSFPLAHLCPDAVVWSVGTGHRQQVDNVQCSSAMKGLIEECWSTDSTFRPSFTEILKELQQTSGLHKKHCSSVPEKLNRAGMHRSLYNF